MRRWRRCVNFAATSRRRCTARRSLSESCPVRNGSASILAVATPSCTARLTPTPPTGDIACAASPRHSSPVRYHRVSLLTSRSEEHTSALQSRFALSCRRRSLRSSPTRRSSDLSSLHSAEVVERKLPGSQWLSQYPGGGYTILYGKIDSHPADR